MSVLLCTFFPCVNSQQCNGYLASLLNSLRTRPRGWQARGWRVSGCAGSAGQHSVVGWAGMRPVLLLLSIAEVWAVHRGKLINNQINYFLNLDSQTTMIAKLLLSSTPFFRFALSFVKGLIMKYIHVSLIVFSKNLPLNISKIFTSKLT